jgi:ABC-2 type transport system ATP-binding protein
MSERAIASLEGLEHHYRSQPALAGIDLELGAGQVVALLGPNGAGKTTLIHLLLGLIPVQRGRIRLFGEHAPGAPLPRGRIGVMLQKSGVQDNLSVAELIDLFGSFHAHRAATEDLLAEAGLEGLGGRRFGRLSGGQQQRVLFALACVGQPDWLILDEPTTGLDPSARRALWRAIEARRASGVSILLCTHYLDEAQRLADRVVVLHGGRVLADGTPDAIRRQVARDRIRVRTRLSVAELGALPAVEQVGVVDSGHELMSSDATASVRALLAADSSADRLEVAPADLETAFLHLTENAA